MKLLKNLLIAGLLALVSVPANAKVIIKEDLGGAIVNYIKKYSDLRDSGEKLVIAGDCASSCTLFLGILPKSQYCVAPKGVLGFHSATLLTMGENGIEHKHAIEFSAMMFRIYPIAFRKLLKSRGWDAEDHPEIAHPELIWIGGKTLRSLVPSCSLEDVKS